MPHPTSWVNHWLGQSYRRGVRPVLPRHSAPHGKARGHYCTIGASIRDARASGLVTVVATEWIGTVAINLTCRDSRGRLGNELIDRGRDATLEFVTQGGPWSFDGGWDVFRPVQLAQRIRLVHLFDPMLAVHTSLVESLPHQLTAVYGEVLSRQAPRYVLADDPDAGKTMSAERLYAVKEEMEKA